MAPFKRISCRRYLKENNLTNATNNYYNFKIHTWSSSSSSGSIKRTVWKVQQEKYTDKISDIISRHIAILTDKNNYVIHHERHHFISHILFWMYVTLTDLLERYVKKIILA